MVLEHQAAGSNRASLRHWLSRAQRIPPNLVRGFLYGTAVMGKRIAAANAVAAVQARIQARAGVFLDTMERAVFAQASSPYRSLLDMAGYDLARVRALVLEHGVEESLRRLCQDGVYIAIEEFKRLRDARRGSHVFRFGERDFHNPLASNGSVQTGFHLVSGGTRSAGLTSVVSAAQLRMGGGTHHHGARRERPRGNADRAVAAADGTHRSLGRHAAGGGAPRATRVVQPAPGAGTQRRGCLPCLFCRGQPGGAAARTDVPASDLRAVRRGVRGTAVGRRTGRPERTHDPHHPERSRADFPRRETAGSAPGPRHIHDGWRAPSRRRRPRPSRRPAHVPAPYLRLRSSGSRRGLVRSPRLPTTCTSAGIRWPSCSGAGRRTRWEARSTPCSSPV